MTKKYFKAGILLAALGIPVFVFLFLKFFGKNNFDLPYFFPVIAENGEVKVINGDTIFHQPPSFQLFDQNKRSFEYNPSKGGIRILSFFFSRCGTICPTTNSNLNRVQEKFKDKISIISITVDPVYDTPEVLNVYAKKYQDKLGLWYFLSGDKKYIYNLAIKGFKLPVADANEYDQNIKSIDETFIHSDKLLLIDDRGFIRGIYSSTDKFEIDRLVVEIKVLLTKVEKVGN